MADESSSSFFSSPAATPAHSSAPHAPTPASATPAASASGAHAHTAIVHGDFVARGLGVPSVAATPVVGGGGMQLSFTPALSTAQRPANRAQQSLGMSASQPQMLHTTSDSAAASGAAFLGVESARPTARSQQFSTTPSVAVPLVFATPHSSSTHKHACTAGETKQEKGMGSALLTALSFRSPACAAARTPSSYVASNRLFAASSNSPLPALPPATASLPQHSHAARTKAGSDPYAFDLAVRSLSGGSASGSSSAASMPPLPPPVHIPRALRALVSSCLSRGHYAGAVFYADKLATLEAFSDESVLTLARAMAAARQWQRAVHLLKKQGLARLPRCDAHVEPQGLQEHARALNTRLDALYVAVQCMSESGAADEALSCALPRAEDGHELDLSDAEARRLDRLLHRVAPCSSDPDACWSQASAEEVRQVLGEEEVALIAALVRYRRIQRAARRAAAQAQQSDADELMTPASLRAQSAGEEDEEGDEEAPPADSELDLCSSFAFLRAQLYSAAGTRFSAIVWLHLALRWDARNFDALDMLSSKRLLSVSEEERLLGTHGVLGPLPRECEWLELVWRNKIDVQRIDEAQEAHERKRGDGMPPRSTQQQQTASLSLATPNTAAAPVSSSSAVTATMPGAAGSSSALVPSPPPSSLLHRHRLLSSTYQFGSNADLLSSLVDYKYNVGQYKECYELAKRLIDSDPFLLSIVPTYVCTLVELKLKSELFDAAHRLVSAYPTRAVSWFAVGSYYYLLGKLEAARRFFYKCTRLDALFAAGWLAFGHTFSHADESEQALLSYRTAARLYEGSHHPLLACGMEYLRTNNLLLADHFLRAAARCNPHDPTPHNELGVLAYKSGDFAAAAKHYLHCLSLVHGDAIERWDATLINLGHAYRRQRKYAEAISAYNRGLAVTARPFGALSALGFTYHLQGALDQAVDYYHRALAISPRDTFVSDMLDRALKELCDSETAFGF